MSSHRSSRFSTLGWTFPTTALALALTGCGPSAGHEEVGASTPSPSVSAEQMSIFQLSPGQCFDRPAEGDGLFRVSVVPCEVAHDQEMYAVLQLDHPSWPGAEAVQTEATDRCAGEFVAFTGATADESRLGFVSFVPSEGSWSEGDRQVLCALELDSGGRLLGSQAGRG
ncbi:septum formation family protein [Micrococcus terreus]|uniref:septum formation family protein n=1 Tax=Micrococcus terreus TaxID=574650 RepID=UPI003D7579A3